MNRVVSIGYGRHIFEAGNPERERLAACADSVAAYDMVIFSKKDHGLKITQPSEKLTLYPTQSRNNLLALVDAFLIARTCIKNSKESVTLTTQDPFETAFIGILLKKFYGVRLVIQEHGDFFGTHHWRRESLLNRVRYYFGLWALKQADTVRVVSVRTKQRLQVRGVKHITVFPVEVDVTALRNSVGNADISALTGQGLFVFLSVARFVPQKNFPLLLHAFLDVYAQAPMARLVVVGRGQEEERMKAIILGLPIETQSAITVLPWSDDVAGLMKSASAYVLSSNYEGWARVLIEALAVQLPIISTKVGCTEEVIIHQEHGLLVEVDNRAQLASAMLLLCTDSKLHARITQNLLTLDIEQVPGIDRGLYAAHWAQIFGTDT